MTASTLVPWLGFVASFGMHLTAASAASRGRAAAPIVLTLGAVPLALPWLFPREQTLLRSFLALAAVLVLARLSDLTRMGAALSWPRRVWHAFGIIDTSLASRARPALDRGALARALGYGALAVAAGWLCLAHGPRALGVERVLARWGGGLVFIYAGIDASYATLTLLYRAAGVVTPELHRAPALSRSVKEFWGRRWALMVTGWLFARVFRPLARARRPALGLAAAFVASAAFHAYLVAASLDATMTAWMFAYFVVQALLVAVEAALEKVHGWARIARLWTVVVMVATSPLFVEPFLRVLDGERTLAPGVTETSSSRTYNRRAGSPARSAAGSFDTGALASTRRRAARPVSPAP